jgi:hypothetical protein
MNTKIPSFARRVFGDQSGQVLPWVAVAMVGLLAMSGLVLDGAHAYAAFNLLQASTNAAALAAAAETYNSTTPTVVSEANAFGADTGGANANKVLGTVITTATAECLNILMPPGQTCPTTNPPPNAVKVTQTASIPTTFLQVIGIKTIPMKATAQASMQGIAQSWNVAIIVDATISMNDPPDSNCTSAGYTSKIACALGGIQSFLAAVNPCQSGYSTCASSNNNVRVSLFTFPNMTTGTMTKDYTCSGSPTHQTYTFPPATASSYSGTSGATYQVTPYESDYYSPTASNGLNSSADIVKAITGCLKVVGGEGTYYAGVIYAAQASLLNEQTSYSGSKNAIILLSDGQAQASSGDMSSGMTGTGLYPDDHDECQQAVMAAKAAATAGTRVYAVAYGSESSGCTTASGGTDNTLVATGSYNVPITSASMVTPCVTMEDIASNLTYFYADASSKTAGCIDNAHSTTTLNGISLSIAASITNPQLLPHNAT